MMNTTVLNVTLMGEIVVKPIITKNIVQNVYVKITVGLLQVHSPWTLGLPGHIASGHFWQVFPHKEFRKLIVIAFEHL